MKTKTQISFAVTAKLISAFVFATWILQSLFFLKLKFQASSHFLLLCSPVCVGHGRKPQRRVFSQRGSYKEWAYISKQTKHKTIFFSCLHYWSLFHMSCIMRKPSFCICEKQKCRSAAEAFCICENKDADQLRGKPKAYQRLCFRYTDSTIPLLPKSKLSSL